MERSKVARSRLAISGLVGLGLLSVLGACANLIGLDKFKDCTDKENADACADATTPPPDAPSDVDVPDTWVPDAQDDGATDAGKDAKDADPPPPDGSVQSDWAKYRVPSYEGGLLTPASVMGPIGDPTRIAPPLTYGTWEIRPRDGGVGVFAIQKVQSGASALTALTWIVDTGGQALRSSFGDARAYCADRGGGVPTKIEALMLLDSARKAPDGGPFMMRPEVYPSGDAGAPPEVSKFWTSTVAKTDGGSFEFWTIDFRTGDVKRRAATDQSNLGVLCVLR